MFEKGYREVRPSGERRQHAWRQNWILAALLIFGLNCYLHPSSSLTSIFTSLQRGTSLDSTVSSFGLASTGLQWSSCGHRFECANLSVSLNYLNEHDERKASIAITRYLASKQPAEGTIIFNPGGPGGSGTGSTYRVGPLLDGVLQGKYDILGFDPRGINKTLPRVSCLQSLETRAALQEILGTTAPNLNIHANSPNDVGIWDSFGQLIAEECEENSGADVLPYVNTPMVARDIASIVDALHAEKKHHVSYWGFSYGTNLGAMFVGMFPNKLHKVILDGIRSPLDAREIYEWGYTSLASQNDVFDGYFSICDQVGASRCPLAGLEKGSKATVMDLLSHLYDRPLPVTSEKAVGLVTYYDYKNFLYGTLYRPRNWLHFAKITADLLKGNGTSFLLATTRDLSAFGMAESGTAVLCTDAEPATNYSLASWSEFVSNMTKISLIAGDSRSLDTIPCRHWHTEPNERWLGSFDDVKLQTPVLMISNTYDPATPIASGRRLAAKLGKNAVLLEQHSYGHCSTSTVSTCTYRNIIRYLLDGGLPDEGTVCEVDDAEFGDYFPHDVEGLRVNALAGTMQAIMGEIN